MKKILSLLIISGLCTPVFLFAETTVPTPSISETKTEKTRHASTSIALHTREKHEEIEDVTHEKGTHTKMNATSTRQGAFCQDLEKTFLYIDTKVTHSEDKKTMTASTTVEKHEVLNTEIAEKHHENETNKNAQIAELKRRATTDAQKQAVATFITTMDEALKTRDAAIDQVLIRHRSEVDKATTARRMETAQALAIRKADIEVAKNKAKTDCTGPSDATLSPEAIRIALRTSIEKAQGTFVATIKNIDKVKDVTEDSRNAKKAELKKIEETYVASMKKAKEDLKLAFKTTGNASTTKQ